jgi:hypothetical protein
MGKNRPKGPTAVIRTWERHRLEDGVRTGHAVYLFEKALRDRTVYAEYDLTTLERGGVTRVRARRQYIASGYPLDDPGAKCNRVVSVAALPPEWRKAMAAARRRWLAHAWIWRACISLPIWLVLVPVMDRVSLFWGRSFLLRPTTEDVSVICMSHLAVIALLVWYALAPGTVTVRGAANKPSLHGSPSTFPPAASNI